MYIVKSLLTFTYFFRIIEPFLKSLLVSLMNLHVKARTDPKDNNFFLEIIFFFCNCLDFKSFFQQETVDGSDDICYDSKTSKDFILSFKKYVKIIRS